MKDYFLGYELLPEALRRAGAAVSLLYKNAWLEPMRNLFRNETGKMRCGFCSDSEALVTISQYYSRQGLRTGCILPVSYLCHISGVCQKEMDAGIVFILIEDHTTASAGQFALAERFSFYIPENAADIYRMIRDGFDDSEIRRIPSLILIRERRLLSGEILQYSRITRPKHNLKDDSRERRNAVLKRIEDTYLRVRGEGETALVVLGDLCNLSETLFGNLSGLQLLLLKRLFPWNKDRIRRLLADKKKVLLVCCESLPFQNRKGIPEIVCLHIQSATTKEQTGELETKVKRELPKLLRDKYRRLYEESILPMHRCPTLPPADRRMCPGCGFRRELDAQMEAHPAQKICENIFCTRLMIYVTSGIRHPNLYPAENAYEALGAGEWDQTHTASFVRNGSSCPLQRGISVSRKVHLNPESCNECGKCIQMTGCPALWERGFRVHVDQGKCVGCGLCVSKCERSALCIS